MLVRKKEGRPLSETRDMKIWREEFEQMSLEEHDKVLKNLGLDEEDIEDFNDVVKNRKSTEELLGIGESEQSAEEKTKKRK